LRGRLTFGIYPRPVIFLDLIFANLFPIHYRPDIWRMLRLPVTARHTSNSQQSCYTDWFGNGTTHTPGNSALRAHIKNASQRIGNQVNAQAAFFTLPARMQAVQTRICFRAPDTSARTRFKFGFQRRLRVLFAWLITLP
jgi:hypothetical protein